MVGPLRMLGVAAVVALLAGCQSAPPRPLFQPLETGAEYGYTEQQIDDSHWEVTFAGPRYRSSYGDSKRDAESEAARDQSYDLALWRAAQIALEQNKPSFAVVSERRDVDHSTEVNRRYSPFPYYGHGYRRYGGWGWPWWYDDYSVRSYGEATVTLTIDLEPDPGAKAIDAKETAARLEDEYAFKTWPPE